MTAIRRAEYRDAKALADVAESTFRATFGALNSEEHMAAHCRASFGEEIQASEISDPGMITLICEHEARLIGFAQLRWGKVPACVSAQRPAEIQRLYVLQDWHGTGVARALMHACVEAAQRREADVVWLGVWERNPRAIAFYEKSGFAEVGDHVFALGGDPQRDVIMVKQLTGA